MNKFEEGKGMLSEATNIYGFRRSHVTNNYPFRLLFFPLILADLFFSDAPLAKGLQTPYNGLDNNYLPELVETSSREGGFDDDDDNDDAFNVDDDTVPSETAKVHDEFLEECNDRLQVVAWILESNNI